MRKKTLVKVLSVVMFALISVSCTLIGSNLFASGDETGLEAEIKTEVKIGETVDIPVYRVEKGGKVVEATAYVTTPEDKVYQSSRFVAEQSGRYTIEYVYDGESVYTAYCTAVPSAMDFFSVNSLATMQGIANYKYQEDDTLKGVKISVADGATIAFDKEIDMTERTKNDLLFSAIVEPTTQGLADFGQMVVTFTDVEDSSVYFKATFTDGAYDTQSSAYASYVNAGANGQSPGGYNYEGGGNRWLTQSIYGTSFISSFRAETNNGYSQYTLELYFDNDEKALYTRSGNSVVLVADFDSSLTFLGSEWGGFPSGRAVASVSFVSFNQDLGNVIFTSIGGVDLRSERLVDDVAPTLNVDLEGENEAPNSVIGTKYHVFSATATDFYDVNPKIGVQVVYTDVKGNKSDVSVTDGTFTTDKLGKYTIIYTASDKWGNTSTKELSFACFAEAAEIEIEGIPDDYAVDVFSSVSILSADELKAYGGNGQLKITRKVMGPDGEECAVQNNAFTPLKIGAYLVSYTATDYYGAYMTKTLTITTKEVEGAHFFGGIDLPDVLLSEFTYTIPEVAAKQCQNGKVLDCNLSYFVNSKEVKDRTFTADGVSVEIEVRASLAGSSEYASLKKTIAVADGKGGKNHTAYFYDKSGTINVSETFSENGDCTGITLKTTADSSVVFANKLKSEAFTLGFTTAAATNKFSTLNVKLTSAENSSEVVTLSFSFSGGTATVGVQGQSGVSFTCENGYVRFTIDSETGAIKDVNSETLLYARLYDNGNTFAGFSGGVYAEIAFVGVTAESAVTINLLNNQSFGYLTAEGAGDNVSPELEADGEIVMRAQVGDTIDIYSCTAFDVLSGVGTVTVRATDPDGNILIQDLPATEMRTIATTKAGTYRVIYTVYDTSENENRQRIVKTIRVVDSVAPTLKVDAKNMTKKVGDSVSLPSVSVSDDSGSVYYDIFVVLPNNEIRLVMHYANGEKTSYLSKSDEHYPSSFKASDTSFNLETSGKYTVTVLAYDDNYNVVKYVYTITVK